LLTCRIQPGDTSGGRRGHYSLPSDYALEAAYASCSSSLWGFYIPIAMGLCAIALSLAALVAPTIAAPASVRTTKTLVAFGDSYTDQSRLLYFNRNHSYPPPHYQPLYPPLVHSSDGGACWVRYAEMYGALQSYNYAVSAAACSNLLTPKPGQGPAVYPNGDYPSVLEYEIPAFAQDWVPPRRLNPTTTLDPDTTVYSLWIGTNDVGLGALLTENQAPGVTIVNTTQCAIEWMTTLYSYGARRFILQNMIPLQITPMYSSLPDWGGTAWKAPHNRTDYSIQIQELVAAGNALWDLQMPAALENLPGAAAAVFNSHALFFDMYNNPADFLNGSQPLNVTGFYGHIGGHAPGDRDSYLWWNELHPSEQAQRNVAKQIVATLSGTSKYATYLGDW